MQERFSRRRLPHWDVPGAVYFVTTCLHDSIPARGLVEISRLRAQLAARQRPNNVSERAWKSTNWKQMFTRVDKWLDHKPAARHLADPDVASEVETALKFFAGDRYDLLAWVVMPSHYHWLFRPRDEWVRSLDLTDASRSPRARILHSINSYTAGQCNRLLGRSGIFWQHESYDHCVWDEDELERIAAYIHHNPVAARIVERPEQYAFSSAREFIQREQRGGQP